MIKDGELTVVKRNSYAQECRVRNLNTTEIKIINFLIANINSPKYDKEFRKFRFEIKEFCNHVYPDKDPSSQYERLPLTLQKLADKSAYKYVDDPKRPGKKKKVLVRWVTDVEFDSAGGVSVGLHEHLAPYLLEITDNFYEAQFRYTALSQSRYTIPLYELLKSWEKATNNVKQFEVMDLREYMDALSKTQDNVSEFKRTALDKAVKEINEITDLNVSYREIKRGRKTTHFEFTILHKDKEGDESIMESVDEQQVPGQLEFGEEKETTTSVNNLVSELLQSYKLKFTSKNIETLCSEARKHIPFSVPHEEWNIFIVDYIREQIKYMNGQEDVQKPYFYLKKCIIKNYADFNYIEEDFVEKARKNIPTIDD